MVSSTSCKEKLSGISLMDLISRRYEIMCHCWLHSPDDRPSFADLGDRLDQLLDERTTEVKSNLKFLMAHQGSVLLRLFWQPPTGSISMLPAFPPPPPWI